MALAEWRTAKRVHLKEGGGRREEGEILAVAESEVREMVLEAGAPMLALEAPRPPLMIEAPKVGEKVAA